MGSIIGGIVGGIGSLVGGAESASAEKTAAADALTGYNYLKTNPLIGKLQTNAAGEINNENTALGNESGTVGGINSLLTSNGTSNPAFQNYLNSTGYNFQMQQGTNAITGNAASKGLLNSGATAKGLQTFGQGLGASAFQNYLGDMSGLAGLQANNAAGYTNLVNQGLTAADAVGAAGSTGGAAAGNFMSQGGQSLGTSMAQAGNYFGGGIQSAMNNGTLNFFGTPSAGAGGASPFNAANQTSYAFGS